MANFMIFMMMRILLKNRRERRATYFQKKTFTLNTFAFTSINLHVDDLDYNSLDYVQDDDDVDDDDVQEYDGDENPPFSISSGKNLGKAGGLRDIFH